MSFGLFFSVSVSVSLGLCLCPAFQAFSIPALMLILYPAEASIPALQLTGTHAWNGIVRKDSYQVGGERIQREEERAEACLLSALKGFTQRWQA